MAINYNDSRFQQVEEEKQQALANVNNTYNNMINEADTYYEPMKAAAEEYGNKQAEVQQAQTDLAIERIENAKDEASKSYTKEQKGAYVDWQKQSNQYGAEAERLASAGLLNSGYSESSQVAMYTAYQNRLGQARDTYNKAVTEYDLGIKDAQIANNAALAEIAYKALQTKLELGLNQFQYKNGLLQEQLATQMSLDNMYYNRRQDVVNQINTENALAEQRRQFNASRSGGGGGYTLTGGGEQLTNGGSPMTTAAGNEALNYVMNFTSGDPDDARNLTKLDMTNLEKYIAKQVKNGMTQEEAAYINNYVSQNFTQNKKWFNSITDMFKGA